MFDYFVRTKDFAVYPQQLFASFLLPFGGAEYLGKTAGEMPVSVGLLLGLGMFLFLFVQQKKEEDPLQQLNRISLVFAAAALVIASTLFPWTYILKIPVLGDLLYSIQFPFRYLSIASLFLAVVFAVSAYKLSQGHTRILIAVCVVLTMFNIAPMLDQYVQSDQQAVVIASKESGPFVSINGLRDYYYSDTDFSALNSQPMQITSPDSVQISVFSKDGLHVDFRYASDAEQTVTLPLYRYPGYEAALDGEAISVSDGENHLLALTLPAGGGAVRVWYQGFWYYTIANFVSLGTALALLAWSLYPRFRKRGSRALKGGAAC